MSEVALDPNDHWETPPTELDPELVETSERLVSLSEKTFSTQIGTEESPLQNKPQDPRILELETQKQYLFQRNVGLVAKTAELEAANLRLQEQVSALKRAERSQIPWYKRLFQ
jgi:hypothetical protein